MQEEGDSDGLLVQVRNEQPGQEHGQQALVIYDSVKILAIKIQLIEKVRVSLNGIFSFQDQMRS